MLKKNLPIEMIKLMKAEIEVIIFETLNTGI